MWVDISSGGDGKGGDIYGGGRNRVADDGGSSMEMKLRESSPDVFGCGTSNDPWLAPSETK